MLNICLVGETYTYIKCMKLYSNQSDTQLPLLSYRQLEYNYLDLINMHLGVSSSKIINMKLFHLSINFLLQHQHHLIGKVSESI